MKKILTLILSIAIILMTLQTVIADSQSSLEDLSNYESLTFDITINANFELEKTSVSSNLNSVIAKLDLKAQDSNSYTTIISESTSLEGELYNDYSKFTFTDLEPLNKELSYFARVNIDSSKHNIPSTNAFPIQLSQTEIEENDLEQYLEITDTIDWDNYEVKTKASTLAQGQTDLFESLVIMAAWVEQNIEYNLSTLNAQTSQPASYVLETRQGVCDEMTSLFIGFARSLGIPARFVSGLSYTRSDLFDKPWQSHGWAEVYLPEIGWVSFDPTFGQYGFVDATHIPLQYSNDPTGASINYEWTGNNVDLISGDIDFEIEVTSYGPQVSNQLNIETNQFASIVDFGSYNLISVNINNQKNSYTAVELQLVTPEEIVSSSSPTKVVVIDPQGNYIQEWIVKVDEDLKREYIYSFPYYVFANSNTNGTNTFSSGVFNPTYTYEEMSSLISSTELSLNTQVSMKCTYDDTIFIEDSVIISCEIKNTGNQIIEQATVCIAEICETFELLLTQTKEISEILSFEETGFQNIQTQVSYDDIIQNGVLSIQVLDAASIDVLIEHSNPVLFTDIVIFHLNLEKTSISSPQNISIEITTPTEIISMDLSTLEGKEEIDFEFDSSKFAFENEITTTITWNDELGESYNHTQTTIINVKARSFVDSIRLFTNKILHLFTIH